MLVHVAEGDSEAHLAVHVHIDKLTSDHASLTTGTNQEKAEHDTLSTRTREPKVTATTHDIKFGFFVRPVQLLKILVATGER